MSTTNEKAASVLGLDAAAAPKEAEYDLVKSLLEAADFRNSEDSVKEIEIRRNGKFLFTVHIRPLGDDEVRLARKKAITYAKNPQGAKYPPIEKEFNANLFNSWLIYLATIDEDREKIWGNKAVMNKCGLKENVEAVDALLRFGEKSTLVEQISEISGLNEDTGLEPEDYAKN